VASGGNQYGSGKDGESSRAYLHKERLIGNCETGFDLRC
jgi:hypothetical protein